MSETSEQRQQRIDCNIANGIDNWDCENDCAFWNGQFCEQDIPVGLCGQYPSTFCCNCDSKTCPHYMLDKI